MIKNFYKKCMPYVVASSLFFGAAFYGIAGCRLQNYTASAMIEGTMPDGSGIDVDEIKSSEVVSRVCEKLGLKDSVDTIRNAIKVETIPDEKEQALYLSKLDHGEAYNVTDKKFLVSFLADTSKGSGYPKEVLNEILQEYFRYFGETYCSKAGGVNDIGDISDKTYDYIEIADVINDSLGKTLEDLNKNIQNGDDFRSSENGYSFSDLYGEFEYIRNVELPEITAEILNEGVTKDKEALITKYEMKNSELKTENKVSDAKIEKLKSVIDSYMNMMSKYEDIYASKGADKDYIIYDVYDKSNDSEDSKTSEETTKNPYDSSDKTTSYDKLLNEYVSSKCDASFNDIDIAYNEYIIDTFKNIKDAASVDEVEQEISSLVKKVNELHESYIIVNDEYNESLGAKNISILSSISVNKNIPLCMYTVMFTIGIFVIEMLIAAAACRVKEISDSERKIGE